MKKQRTGLSTVISYHHVTAISLLLLILLAVVMRFDTSAQGFSVIRAIIGSVVMLVLPGRWITEVAFKKQEIDMLERFALSFALSISIVPLLVFYINIFGIKITERLVLGVITLVVVSCMLIKYFRT